MLRKITLLQIYKYDWNIDFINARKLQQLQALQHFLIIPDQMLITLIWILTLASLSHQNLVALHQWAAGVAHTSQAIQINIYNDNSRFVSGSNDFKVKVWSLTDYSLLHTQIFGNLITHITLHPVDNRIFVLAYDGTIRVLDPNTYAVLRADVYPNSGNGNYLRFFASNTKYILGGYDGAGSPVFHIYDSTTYLPIAGGATTIFGAGEQMTVTSVSRDGTLIGAISSEATNPINILLYNLNTNTLTKSYTDNELRQNWILFNPFKDQFYVNANDKTIRCFKLNPFNNQYVVGYTFPTQDYGYPNGISANVNNQIVFSANDYIVFLNTTNAYPQVMFSRKDQADIFVLDLSLDGKYLITGMRNGQITVWQVGATQTAKDEDILLVIILGATIGGVILSIITAVIIYKFCCAKGGAVKNEGAQQQRKNESRKINNRTENSIVDYNNMDASIGIS